MALDATSTNASDLWADMNATGVTSSGTILNNTTWTSSPDYSSATAAEQTTALNMLKWLRGTDVMDEDIDGSTSDTRPWMLSDPIHSRPLTINYGITGGGYTTSNPDVRIIITGNDGFVHMFNNTTSAGLESGQETWAFIPRYGLRLTNRLMMNVAGSPLHPYGVDGAPSVYAFDSNGDGNLIAADGDKVYLYFGMRRGGRYYYALDISDPDQPKILWSISDNDADFSELGLTFSKPQIIRLNYDSNTLKPALIFGGGYDTNKDTRSNSSGSDDSRGNAIFIVDAEDGSLIWKATLGSLFATTTEFTHPGLLDSIPADVTAIDANGDGAADRFYVGDTGGTIWRGDLTTGNRNNWKLQKFATIGRHYSNQKRNDRRFFHPIDVVQSRDSTGPFDAVIIGSGDRTNPLDKGVGTNVPENWFYMFKDREVASGATLGAAYPYDHTTVADLSDNCMQEYGATCSPTQVTKLDNYGWKIKLEQATGEKALSRPITLNGMIFFTSYMPPSGSGLNACGPDEGSGLTYALSLQDATAVIDNNLSNSVSTPTGDVINLQSGDRFRDAGAGIPADVIAIRKNGGLHVITPGDNYTTPIKTNSGYKTFWYVEGD
jgi:type IV pilus assembly protein PilY1